MSDMNFEELRLSLFASPKSYSSVMVPLSEIVRLTRHDGILQERTRQFRETMAAMGKKTANKNIKEKLVHAFSVAVTFRGIGHSSDQAQGWTGLAMCDIDKVEDPDELEAAFGRLSKDPHALMVYRTISGTGLRVLYRYQREGGQKIDDTSWRAAFMFGNEQLSLVAGHAFDEACMDYTRLSGMAYDPQLYFNPDPEPYIIPDDLIVEENCEYQEHGKPRTVSPPGTHQADVEQAWQRIQATMREKGFLWEPHHHHDYVLHASYLFNRYGVDLDKLLAWAGQEWADYDAREREDAIRHRYKDTDRHGTWKLNKPTKGRENAMVTLPEIRQWLSDRITVRYNLVTDQMLWCPKGDDDSQPVSAWKLMDYMTINTLRGKIAMETGKRVLSQDVKGVIESDFAEQVHPIREYVQQLSEWDGVDRVAEVTAHVHVAPTAFLPTEEEAQASLLWALHKWLVGMVATWMNDKECNQEVLTFIGPQGIYKTTFFRHILPPELNEYFLENTHNSFGQKDDRIALTENCLVDIEEIEAIEGGDMEQLKGLVTSQYIKERRPYAIFRERKHRLASFCATGNRQRILTDASGTRRWFCYLIKAIDNPRAWNLDYEQLYAQLYYEYQQGFQYYLTNAEENRLELRNSPFKLISPEEELINSRLRKPCGNEAAKLMSATMIATFLTGSVRGGLDVQKIGVIMHKLQYKFKIRHGYCYYRVVEIPYDQQQNYLALDDDYENNDNNENIQSNEELELPF